MEGMQRVRGTPWVRAVSPSTPLYCACVCVCFEIAIALWSLLIDTKILKNAFPLRKTAVQAQYMGALVPPQCVCVCVCRVQKGWVVTVASWCICTSPR